MNKELFVLIIGIAGGGTTGTRGLINLSPCFNVAFEERQEIFEKGQEIFEKEKNKNNFSKKFNGNKIAINRNLFKIENLVECIEQKKIIMHSKFLRLKIVFVDRNPIDTVCSNHFKRIIRGKPSRHRSVSEAIDNWFVRKRQIGVLKRRFKEHISFDFYSLILEQKVRKDLFKYIEDSYLEEYGSIAMECNWYGRKKLNIDNLTFNSLRKNGKYQKQMDLTKEEFIKKGISFE